MDLSLLDQRPGSLFSTKVKSLLCCSVTSGSGFGFWLLAAFPCSKLRLSEDTVGFLLQSALGGVASEFLVKEVADWVFKFRVTSKEVGFLVYGLKDFSSDSFRVVFNICNDIGFDRSVEAISPSEPWQRVSYKKVKKSYVEAVKTPLSFSPSRFDPRTGANASVLGKKDPLHPRASVFARLNSWDLLRNSEQGSVHLQAKNTEQGSGRSNFTRTCFHGQANQERDLGSLHCSRCLSNSHARGFCRSNIRCHACLGVGHVAERCGSVDMPSPRWRIKSAGFSPSSPPSDCFGQRLQRDRWESSVVKNWFKIEPSIQRSLAGTYQSFTHFSSALFGKSGITTSMPWFSTASMQQSMHGGPGKNSVCGDSTQTTGPHGDSQVFFASFGDFCLESKGIHRYTCVPWPSSLIPASPLSTENPSSSTTPPPGSKLMAFKRDDPRPFMPPGFQPHWVLNRETMVRAVVPRWQALREDFAIVRIEPMPEFEVEFQAISDVIREFFEDHMNVRIKGVFPCHLGQAYVQFEYVFDRDTMVLRSPHPFAGGSIIVQKHNEGRNWRSVLFNQECWLMLLGYLFDNWNHTDIEQTIGYFAKLISWEQDKNHPSRLILKARVVDLESIPQFVVFSDGTEFHGQSWTIQVEILQHRILGGLPEDEARPPDNDAGNQQPPFDFYGYGQPGNRPINQWILGNEPVDPSPVAVLQPVWNNVNLDAPL